MRTPDHKNKPNPDQEIGLVTFEWVETRFNLSRSTLRTFIREGLIAPSSTRPEPGFSPGMVDRLIFILYLQRELGVNLAGIGIILDLRSRLDWHVRRMKRPSSGSLEGISSEEDDR